jgi:integrase
MKQKSRSPKNQRKHPRNRLRLPDLELSKAAVVNSLTSVDGQRGYGHAIDEFVEWYCSEPRLTLNRTVVLRYRSHLEARSLAPGTINLRLGAVRRLAYEAADCGLLSSDLASGIRRVKAVRNLGSRLGNWLTAEEGLSLWQAPDINKFKGKRDRALLALLLACGLRRHEAVCLRIEHLEQREEHWAIVDLKGKAGHVRTVPIPEWVMDQLRIWLNASGIERGKIFRRVTKTGRILGEGYDREGSLAYRQTIGNAHRTRQACAPRPAPNLRSPVPCSRRRVGANPVPVRSRIRSDNRTLFRMQAADSFCRERQDWT